MPTFTSPRDRMPADSHCLYTDQQNFKVEYPELQQQTSTRVCIIGGGFVGVMSAVYLAQLGVESILIERHRVGWGASGRNSGQIIPGFNADPRSVIKDCGLDAAKEIYRLNLAAKDDILHNIQAHAPRCDYRQGLTIPALSERAHNDQQSYAAFMKETFGYNLRVLSAQETRNHLGTEFYHAGMEDMNGGHFNPLKYLNQMAHHAHQNLGVKIYENTPAVALHTTPHGVEVETPAGIIKADKVLIAGGGYLGHLVPAIRQKYVLVRTSMLATQTLPEPLQHEILPARHAVYEWRRLLNYYAKTADGRLIFGGGDSALFANKKQEAEAFTKIYSDMVRVFPQLKDVHITHWWGGYLDVTAKEMPEVTRLNNNILYATGFSGHGVVPTHMAAKLLANMAADDALENPMSALRAKRIPGAGRHDYTLAKLGLLWAKAEDAFTA